VFSVTPGFLDGCRVLVLEGDLDAAEAASLDEAIDACTDGFPVVVDLSSLMFIDSAGIHTLLRERTVATRLHRACAGSNVARVLDIVDVEKAIPVYDDVTEAVQRLRAAS
jgi:anti-anti-sigma factor